MMVSATEYEGRILVARTRLYIISTGCVSKVLLKC
jgi:hypothetical protein